LALAIAAMGMALLAASATHAAEPFEVQPLPTTLNLHGAAIVGDYMYVISGDKPQPEGFTNQVISAKINDDLTLQPWIKNRPLPVNLIYLANNIVVVGDVIYVIGGQEVSDIPGAANPGSEYNHAANNTAVYAKVGENGILTPWLRSSPYPGKMGQGSAAATDGHNLYVIGGLNDPGDNASPEVFCAPLNADGTVGTWVPTSKLPTALWSHAAYFHNGSIYVLGGRAGSNDAAITNRVLVGRVGDQGGIESWIESPSSLAYPVEVASVCAADDFLFLFCGRTQGGQMIEKIQFSMLTAEGLSPWQEVPTVMNTRIYASAALDRRRRAIYIAGGRFTDRYRDLVDKVYCFRLLPKAEQAAPAVAPQMAAAPAFAPHEQALARAQAEGKNLFLFAYSNNIEFTRQELAKVSASPEFLKGTDAMVLGMMDVSKHGELAEKMRLLRVPTFMIVDPAGNIVSRESGRKSIPELLAFIAKAPRPVAAGPQTQPTTGY